MNSIPPDNNLNSSDGMQGWISRRDFFAAVGCIAFAGGGCAAPQIKTLSKAPKRPRIAIVGTIIRKHSHMQHFVDRFLEGYGWQGRWHRSQFDLAGLYVDQFPDGDLSRERSHRFNVPLYPSVEEALTLGGSKLDVDGVLIIGEHGVYSVNAKKQTLYPRYRWFKQIVRLFEQSGRAVPVFNDKHLSVDWSECVEMVADSHRLDFPFLAGSSLPVTWRIPDFHLPLGTPLIESVCIGYGGVDSYDFHGLETAQCISERRLGGEVGVRSVQVLKGEAVCDYLERRPSTLKLAFAALSRSETLKAPEGYTYAVPNLEWLRRNSGSFLVYDIEHLDGFRTSLLMLNGLVQEFTYAGMLRNGKIVSSQFYLPMPPATSTVANFFSPLVHNIERMMLERRAPYPVERTLLTSGMTALAVDSIAQDFAKITSPTLKVAYHPPDEPCHWRA